MASRGHRPSLLNRREEEETRIPALSPTRKWMNHDKVVQSVQEKGKESEHPPPPAKYFGR
jgi:hypothetical protein